MNAPLAVLLAGVVALGSAPLFAAETSEAALINESMNLMPLTPEQTKQLKAQRDAAKAKWASMSQAQKNEVMKGAKSKRIGDLNAIERVGQNDDMVALTKSETAQLKAEREAAQAKWAKMTPDEKAAVRKAAQQKRMADLNATERAGQNDDMSRYLAP